MSKAQETIKEQDFSQFRYKRVLLKLSGEMFSLNSEGIDFDEVNKIAKLIKLLNENGVEVAVVNGAGNLFRGAKREKDLNREDGDYIGMVATVMNSLSLQAQLNFLKVKVKTFSAKKIEDLVPAFNKEEARQALSSGEVVIATFGTGKPFLTTDTAGVQRAVDLDCDLMIKASTVDGVYTDDPKLNNNSVKYEQISYDEVLTQNLKVLDREAIELAKTYKLKIIVTSFDEKSILTALRGEPVGTVIGESLSKQSLQIPALKIELN